MNPNKKSYLPHFSRVKETLGSDFELIGDVLIVESLPIEEIKTESGLIIASGTSKQIDGFDLSQTNLVRVVSIGTGYFDDETNLEVPLDTKEGDMIMVSPLSIKWLSKFGPLLSTKDHQIGITRESEIQIRFRKDSYEKALVLLKEGATS